MKRIYLPLLAGSLLLSNITYGNKSDQKKPNIIFIVTDDLGWSDLGSYGADLHETPNLDRLASKSAVFTNSYSAAPICSPTRVSLMTGKYPARLHYTIWREAASGTDRQEQISHPFIPPVTIVDLPLEEVTIAEKLKENGYLTAHVGKWHIGDLLHYPKNQGFDISVGTSQSGSPKSFFYPFLGRDNIPLDNLETDGAGKYFKDQTGKYQTDRLTEEAIKILQDAGDHPFYLNLCYYDVHTPIEAKADDIAYFKNKLTPQLKHQNEIYAAKVKAVDDNVGKLLQKLDDLGIAQNTIVIFISDNGGYILKYKERVVTNNDPLRSGKGSLYEGGIRIPTIIFDPFNSKGKQTIDTPISTIDFFPTLLERCGIKNSNIIDGKSFNSRLNNSADTTLNNRPLFWHYPHYYPTMVPVSAVREGKWKLIEFLEDGHTELYNLAEDLSEVHNLVNEKPLEAQRLTELLYNWKKQVGAQEITENPNYRK